MTLNILKSKKDWLLHLKIMEGRFNDGPGRIKSNEPKKFPCLVVSCMNTDVNGLYGENLFVYKEDLELLKSKK